VKKTLQRWKNDIDEQQIRRTTEENCFKGKRKKGRTPSRGKGGWGEFVCIVDLQCDFGDYK